MAEEGLIQGARGGYQLARTIGDVKVPVTVQAVLAARIDRLAPSHKELLQTAAVIGRQFSTRLLGRVSGLAGQVLKDGLRALVEAELINDASTSAEERYAFKHALTEEVAYGSQLVRRRSRIHASVAGVLTELDPEKLDERASLIAHHFQVGDELLEAARWNARAAGWAGIHHPVDAIRHWRRVRALTDQLELAPETAELGINARLMLLAGHWRLGAASEEGQLPYEDEAAAVFSEGERLADAGGQAPVKVFLLALFGAVRMMSDALPEGHELLLRAMRLADDIGDPGLRASARIPLGWSLYMLGRAGEAAAVAEEISDMIGDDRSMARGVVVTSPYGWCRMARAFFAAHCGRLDEELLAIEQSTELLGDEGDAEFQSHGHRNWAIIADLAGADPDAAANHARQALEWAEEAGGPWSRIFTREGVAVSHNQRGEWREAIDVVDEALAIARDFRIGLYNEPLLLATQRAPRPVWATLAGQDRALRRGSQWPSGAAPATTRPGPESNSPERCSPVPTLSRTPLPANSTKRYRSSRVSVSGHWLLTFAGRKLRWPWPSAMRTIASERRMTVVFITHDLEEAIYLGDRVIVLGANPGHIVELVDVGLPRPRNQLTTREDFKFLSLRHRLFGMLQGH